MFWFKKKVIETNEAVKKQSLDEILNNPFRILNRKSNGRRYYIEMYSFYDYAWYDVGYNSEVLLGVEKYEFIFLATESFSAIKNKEYLRFNTKEDAQIFIEEIRPYYDSYYIPRVIIEKLTKFDEENGGYPVPMYIKERVATPGAPYQLKVVK